MTPLLALLGWLAAGAMAASNWEVPTCSEGQLRLFGAEAFA